MERQDSAKQARRHADKAVNHDGLTPDQHIALAAVYVELAKVEEYNRRTLIIAKRDSVTGFNNH